MQIICAPNSIQLVILSTFMTLSLVPKQSTPAVYDRYATVRNEKTEASLVNDSLLTGAPTSERLGPLK